jgi:hypothetical protein
MLRKSLFLLLTVALAAGLMFAGCQQDVEYREVPGPTVTLPGNDNETTVTVPGKDIPVPIPADITVTTSASLRDALSNPDYDVIAVNGLITLRNNAIPVRDRGDLVIPAGKTLYLYAGLAADVVTPPITIDVQGELVIGYGGILSAGVEHQVKVSGEGSIKVQEIGILETDVPASVNDGAATVLGTPQVLINGYGKDYADDPTALVGKAFMGATLRYTNSVLTDQWALIETAFDSYITQGILELSSAFFKPSDLVKLVADRPASVGKKAFKAKALVDETATALTIPVNAYILTNTDGFTDVTSLTVRGHLDTGIDLLIANLSGSAVFGKLTSLTIAGEGILKTRAGFGLVQVADIALGGSLIDDTVTFASLTDLTVNGTMVLDAATFDDLTSLNITADSYLKTGSAATFTQLQSLTMGEGAYFEAPTGSFNALDGTLTVNGTFEANAGEFRILNELVVNGEFEVGGTGSGTGAFSGVSTLTVTGKGNLSLTNATGDHFVQLDTLTVEKGGAFTVAGTSTFLADVETLTVGGEFGSGIPNATWATLATLTVTETGVFTAGGGADFDAVTSLTLNGTFTASAGTFAGITNVEGAGTLIAGNVSAVGTPSKAWVLYDSPLTSVSLASTGTIFTDDVTVPAGRTRIFTAAAGDIDEKITVEPGATLVITTANVNPNGGGGTITERLIEVSGTLKFTGIGVQPDTPITVKEGGALIFDGANAVPTSNANINVASGATLAFNAIGAAPLGNITVNGTLVVGDGGIFTIASTGTLALNGTLDAGDLTAQGLVFPGDAATGGVLTITGNYISGSIIGITLTTTTTTLKLQPNGYIRDVAARAPWSLEGGNASGGALGNLVLTGTNSPATVLTLGQGTIGVDSGTTLSLNTGSEVGVVTLNNGAYLVAKPHSVPAQTIGLNLSKVIIDLTEDTTTLPPALPIDKGKIVVEPGAKLRLVAGGAPGNALGSAGVIITDGVSNGGLVGGLLVNDLSSGFSGATVFGVINGDTAGKTIDKGDAFGIGTVGSGNNPNVITVTRN